MNRVFNNVFVRDVLFENGLSEDGELRYAKAWNIYAENDYGERLLHTMSDFCDLDPEGFEKAERFVKRIKANIDAGGSIDRDRWYDVDPRYGSAAYVDFGTEESATYWERANG
jgi:hypothetical protein